MFDRSKELKRSTIHDQYGGNLQSGISYPANLPFIFIFTGESGKESGYTDGWLNSDIFYYSGEGSKGDMTFTRGNLKLQQHKEEQRRVFLFEATRKGYVKYVDEVELYDIGFDSVDGNGIKRRTIKFFFSRVGKTLSYQIEPTDSSIYKISEPDIDDNPTVTERSGLVVSRVGQGAYRKSILHRWGNRCAVTGYDYRKILIASHILPWRESSDKERMDVANGILLSPAYDALFDQHLVSFADEGNILLSSTLKHTEYEKLGVTGNEVISGFSERNAVYLERHRKVAGV